MSKVEVNQISSQCGSTLTIGQSGDTVTLAAGATQTGFGRTGTVDWDTTAKTASFTAVSGNGYFVNTTSGAITVTMPASPSAGDIVAVSDYAQTAETNNITIGRNGSNIEGDASDLAIQNNGVAMTFVYADATKGWKVVSAGTESDKAPVPQFIIATGGTETTSGDYKIHTFTGPGTFCVSCAGNPLGSATVDYLVVAGGGGGGLGTANLGGGGGAGAGGYRESSGAASGCYTVSPLGAGVSALPVTVQGYPVVVGGGGTGSSCEPQRGTSGSDSTFSSITSGGGGGGGSASNTSCLQQEGGNGGSGGGAGSNDPAGANGGSGNTPPVSPPQGQNGAGISFSGGDRGLGGGGATQTGNCGSNDNGGPGGDGATSSINATPTARAGGGGGGVYHTSGGCAGTGGAGGGGNGGKGAAGCAGTANTGGGGGGGGRTGPGIPRAGGAGGSGIVIIRYKYQ